MEAPNNKGLIELLVYFGATDQLVEAAKDVPLKELTPECARETARAFLFYWIKEHPSMEETFRPKILRWFQGLSDNGLTLEEAVINRLDNIIISPK